MNDACNKFSKLQLSEENKCLYCGNEQKNTHTKKSHNRRKLCYINFEVPYYCENFPRRSSFSSTCATIKYRVKPNRKPEN